jgi:2',3'-cyclic-nucleotide 2'-phosphodiesterase (5'-nucleotidase family)
VIFVDGTATTANTFKSNWFGASPPVGLQVGSYTGSSIGLSGNGDAVNLYTAAGTLHSGVSFGIADATSPFQTFDNTAALYNTAISLLSTVGVNGAITAANSPNEIGSPGFSAPGLLRITEVAPWSSGNSPVGADWFEVTNNGGRAVDLTGWKTDDSSESFAGAAALNGITSIAPGESVIFIETADLPGKSTLFRSNWFGASPPVGLQIGSYNGSGGLGTGGDAVNLFDSAGVRRAKVEFAISPSIAPFTTFDNAAGVDAAFIPTFSAVGVNGAFVAANSSVEIGSPGTKSSPAIGVSSVSIDAAAMSEGNSGTTTLNLPVTRTNTASVFTVDYTVTGGTATSGTDFTLASGTLSFAFNGAASQNIAITINGDTTIESNETITVTLSNIVNANGSTTLGTAFANGTITNDDTVPVSFPSSGAVTSTVKGFIDLDASPLTGGAEIPAYDPASKRAFTSSNSGIQVIDLTNPAAPTFISTIAPASLGVAGLTSNDVSSITMRKGTGGNPNLLAAGIISSPKSALGYVVFLNPATGALLGSTQVGANPDHIAFSPDGTKLLVANEGELDAVNAAPTVIASDTTVGSVSIISVPASITGVPTSLPTTTADFTAYDSQAAALSAAGVRIFAGGKPSTDFEPEYFAISADSTKAMVTLQEANAVATLDIATATFTSVVPLGKKNFATGRHDFSDADGAGGARLVNPTTGNPVYGLYMPDAVASYSASGQTYYITANEGDDRNDWLNPDETILLSNAAYDLDDTVFPNEAALKSNAALGKLTVCNSPGLRGDTDNDGDIDEILSYGGRSFSILDSTGAIVWDSGDMIENIMASQFPANFDDGRSDNKGSEPEGVTIATLGARTYAFIGLERSHMTLMFDVTNPAAVTFAGGLARTGDLNPEGLVVVSAGDSPTGKPLLLVASEVSQTLTVFELNQTTDYTLQVLHYYGESGLLGIQTAPIMGAMIDKFDDQYSNTVVIGEGDSYIPGPWLIAGADPVFNNLLHTTDQVYSGNNGALGAAGSFNATATATTAVPFGRADIAIMNAFNTTVSALGNHEFDLGSPVLASAIYPATTSGSSAVGNWVGAKFPHITSNLNFAGDSSLRGRADTSLGGTGGNEPNVNAITLANIANIEVSSVNMQAKIAPYAIKTINGQKIGFVGATNWDLLTKTSPNGTVPKDDANAATSDLQEVAAYLQGAVDSLLALGVNKIIQVDQLDDLQRNKDLAPLVSGIDIVIAGGGHERMGDATDTAVAFNGHDSDFIADAYPIKTVGLDGKPMLIVTTDTEYTYLGRLVADFDADGVLILPNLNPAINGAYASTAANLQSAYGTTDSAATIIAGSAIGSQVKTIVDAINNVVVTKDGNVYGYTNVYLEGDRVFGRTQEVNLGNITADANALKARNALGLGLGDAVFSLKNGGGIRASLGSVLANGAKIAPIANPLTGKPAGGISQLDVENALRFDNKLMVFDTTPLGLKNILEYASGLSSGSTAQNGGYPQVGNIRFSYDSTLAAGSRLRSAALVNEAGQIVAKIVENGAVLPTAPATIKCVALSFTVNGGDGYPIKYLNPPTNTIVNNETSNFKLLLTAGGLSGELVDRSLDFTAATTYTSLGLTAADVLGEQKAFQDFLAARHPSLATAYNAADTAVALDTRIQQLAFRTDNILSGPFTFSAYLASGVTNTDGDELSLLEEFAFGLNPAVNDSVGVIANIPAGTLTARGTPTIYSAATPVGRDFRYVFVRVKNAASVGITYTPEFSNDMTNGSWESRADLPVTVIASDGDYELVSVKYPLFSVGKKARFARLSISAP